MKTFTRPRVVAPAPILVDRMQTVSKGDRGIVLAGRGNGRNKAYDVVFTSTAEAAGGYPVHLTDVPAEMVLLV